IAQPAKSASSSQDRHLRIRGSRSGSPACCSNASGSSKNTNWPTSSSFYPKRQQKHSVHATFLSRNYFTCHAVWMSIVLSRGRDRRFFPVFFQAPYSTTKPFITCQE